MFIKFHLATLRSICNRSWQLPAHTGMSNAQIISAAKEQSAVAARRSKSAQAQAELGWESLFMVWLVEMWPLLHREMEAPV